jgi:homeobox-leucine zipper protein
MLVSFTSNKFPFLFHLLCWLDSCADDWSAFDEGGRPVLGGLEEGRGVKRPFFTSPDELLEEEYYDEQLPEKKRRLTPEQVNNHF